MSGHTSEAVVSGEDIFKNNCASCHDAGLPIPTLDAMRAMSRMNLGNILRFGKMKAQAESLSRLELDQLLQFLKGVDSSAIDFSQGMCESEKTINLKKASVGRWGFDAHNTRFQPSTRAGINRKNVKRLRLKWAFGVPGASTVRSQPVITENSIFLSTTPGYLFALDKHSGCIQWVYNTEGPLRSALFLGTIPDTGNPALFFAGHGAFVFAVDPVTGTLIWKKQVDKRFPRAMITGSPVQHGGRLFIPLSSSEISMPADPNYECCKTHGGVIAMDANNGKTLWATPMAKPAEPTFKNSLGVQQWGPSGAPVWTTPAIDAKRGLLYVGTGENYSSPANHLSDAIVALSMETGAIEWYYQATANDAYNMACSHALEGDQVIKLNGPNCPPEDGPDVDFGASVIITKNSQGKDVLLAGQKSGDVHALDPDANGRLFWRRKLSGGSPLGGVHWGMTANNGRVFVPLADPELPMPGYVAEPGLVALRIDDGKQLWEQRLKRSCDFDMARFVAEQKKNYTPWPKCDFFYGLSAAASSTEELVFTASLDGLVRIYDTQNGDELWQFNSVREFDTVNGVQAHGGAIDNAGVQVADGLLIVQSGYANFDQMPGNVLLVFEAEARELE